MKMDNDWLVEVCAWTIVILLLILIIIGFNLTFDLWEYTYQKQH